jgi:hypothetical protein
MTRDWGYAALVEINGKRILFDTGDDPAIFANNVKAKRIDLTKLDFVVLSHRHGDHVSGVSHLLSVNPRVKIYAPKDGLGGIFGSDVTSGFYRKDAALPAEQRYYGGTAPEIIKLGTVFRGANIQLIDKTTEVVPGITLIALVSDVPGTKELKELSLAVNTADGIVLTLAVRTRASRTSSPKPPRSIRISTSSPADFIWWRPRTPPSKRLPRHCMRLTKWTSSLPVTVPANLLSPHCKGGLAIITSTRGWGRHLIWARIRASHRIEVPSVSWTQATCAPTARYSPKAMT